MSDIAAVVGPGAGRLDTSMEAAPRAAVRETPGRIERPSDKVELSDRARLLHKIANLPPVRQDLIERVKQEINRGAYDTPDRIEAAIDHLVEDIDLLG